MGRSKLERFYAIIVTPSGGDLARLLVEKKLARVYGTRTELPDGKTSRDYLRELGE